MTNGQNNIKESDDALWTKSYTAGVPTSIDLGEDTFIGVIDGCMKSFASRRAVQCLGATWTYERLDNEATQMAAALQKLGLEPGARVAIMMPSIPQYLVIMLGILRAGFVVVNVNPLYTPRELDHQLNDSGAEVIFLLEQFAATFEKVQDNTRVSHAIVTSIGEMFGGVKGLIANFVLRNVKKAVPAWNLPKAVPYGTFFSTVTPSEFKPQTHKPEDIAVLQYTGGTTGVAKGAMLTQRNLLAASKTAGAWLQPALDEAPKIEEPIFLIPLPLYHIFTLYVTSMGLFTGACCVLVPNPRDLDSMIKAMAGVRFNLMIGLNTLYAGILKHKDIGSVDFTAARAFVAGGTATHKAVADNWQKTSGRPILEGWGMTETTGAGTCNPYPLKDFTGTIGLPMPGISISIRDENDNDVMHGEPGEIWIKGPNVMSGYWQHPEASEAAFDNNGYLATGDIGVMDERGFVSIVDRKKDMVLVSGFNVYPNEVEDVLSSCDGVEEAAVIGVPDEQTGEAVKVFVVRCDDGLDEAKIMAYCRANLTGYKCPKHVEFIDSLPKSPVGKILRKELRQEPIGETN